MIKLGDGKEAVSILKMFCQHLRDLISPLFWGVLNWVLLLFNDHFRQLITYFSLKNNLQSAIVWLFYK